MKGSSQKRTDWYNAAKGSEESADRLWATIGRLETKFKPLHEKWLSLYKMYLDEDVESLSPEALERGLGDVGKRSRKNVVASGVDAFVSKVVRNRVRSVFLPSGADPTVRRRAEMAEQFVEGVVTEQRLRYRPYRILVKSCAILGAGCFKTRWTETTKGGRRADLVVDYVPIWELLYDPSDCPSGRAPRELYHCQLVSKEALISAHRSKKSLIEQLPTATGPVNTGVCSYTSSDSVKDRVRVVEAWRRSSGPDKGSYSVFVEGDELYREDFDQEFFPFSFLEFEPKLTGWSLQSQGMVEKVRRQQHSLNVLCEDNDASFKTVPRVMLFPKGGIEPESIARLTQRGLNAVEYTNGAPPVLSTPDPVSPQMLQREQSEVREIYNFMGISESHATAQKPRGLESGRALVVDADIKAERFLAFHEDVSKFWVDVAMSILRTAHAAQKAGYDVESFQDRASFVEALNFSDITFDKLKFFVKPLGVNQMPHDLKGQVQLAEQLIQMGLVSRPGQIAEVLTGLPDMVSEGSLYTAGKRAVERDVQSILDGVENIRPGEFDDAEYAAAFATAELHKIRHRLYDKKKDSNLEGVLLELTQYINTARQMIPPPPAPEMPPAQ